MLTWRECLAAIGLFCFGILAPPWVAAMALGCALAALALVVILVGLNRREP